MSKWKLASLAPAAIALTGCMELADELVSRNAFLDGLQPVHEVSSRAAGIEPIGSSYISTLGRNAGPAGSQPF